MKITEEEYLAHIGVLRRSGRYPWGSGQDQSERVFPWSSGETQVERNRTFLGLVDHLQKNEGMKPTEVAKFLGLTTTELRAAKSIAKNAEKQADISEAWRLKNKGYSNVAIGEKMGKNESTVRSLLAPGQKDKLDVLHTTANMLKEQVVKKGYIDIGTGVEHHLLGISNTKLATAVALLKEEGYEVHKVKIEQLGTGHQTELKVLAPPGTTQKEVWQNRYNIKQITDYSEDGGRSFLGIDPPVSVNSKRIAVRYAKDGGADADGVIYIRPGVDDLSLGKSHYAQVRIAVDNTHYLKGMAMYKDDLPPGVDLVFNTNKNDTGNKLDAFKEMLRDNKTGQIDLDNPFGSTISRQHGVMNIVNEEGKWETWSKSLSSQMLSKQPPSLAKSQLNMTFERKRHELDEIKALTHPSVRRKLLEAYADDADSSAVHLKAAHLPRQANYVILPINSMKDTEIYAPNFRDGEIVVLIRHPHGGIFEIPELRVNNRHPEAKRLLGENIKDAVGIHSRVAEKLSGADFDGDTVLVIPNNSRKIKTASTLAGLKDFDPKAAFPSYPGMIPMDSRTKGFQMGDISNLITDMSIKGASMPELARAVRHSMVVIDAEKHNLNYKLSAEVNGIAQLKAKYQGRANAGASTLISRASSRKDVLERKQGFKIDPVTGKKIFTETGNTWVNKQGRTVPKTQRSTKLAETDDAHTLSTGTLIEKLYADHSNKLKALANEARLEALRTKSVPYSPSAKLVYAKEVESLNAKLNLALRNRPLERQAQVIANSVVVQKRQANPEMDKAELKKIKFAALEEARIRTGAEKQRIDITDREWDAIQAGAISANKLNDILTNTDLDQVKKRATPRAQLLMTSTKRARAIAMLADGYTRAEIADHMGMSVSTLNKGLSSEEVA